MSKKFVLRKLLGNRSFLDYKPEVFWRERSDGRGEENAPWLPDFVKFLKENKCKSVLEIGCGSGVNLGYAKRVLKNLSCTGFDLSEKHIETGRAKYPEIELFCADLRNQDFGSHDCILTSGVLMHVLPRDINKTIEKIKTSSKKAIFCYEFRKKDLGSRHPNNFVFNYDYQKLFSSLEKKFFKEYGSDYSAFGFTKQALRP